MSAEHAAPWTQAAGEVASLRACIYNALRLPAQAGASIGIVSTQATGLLAGDDVVFTTAQLQSFFASEASHPSLPPDLTTATSWTLSGLDTLTAVT